MERRISRLMPQQQSGHFQKGLSWPQLCLLDDTRHLLVQHHHEELWHGSSAVCKRQLGQKTGKQRGNLGISTSTGHWWPSSFGSLAACIDLDWKLEPPQTHQEYSKQQYQKHNRRHWMPSFCLQLVEEAFVFGWSSLFCTGVQTVQGSDKVQTVCGLGGSSSRPPPRSLKSKPWETSATAFGKVMPSTGSKASKWLPLNHKATTWSNFSTCKAATAKSNFWGMIAILQLYLRPKAAASSSPAQAVGSATSFKYVSNAATFLSTFSNSDHRRRPSGAKPSHCRTYLSACRFMCTTASERKAKEFGAVLPVDFA